MKSCTNKYQERDKIWLDDVYWSVEKKFQFSLNLKKIRKKWSPKHSQLQRKQTLSDVFYFEKLFFLFLSNWLGKYYPPQGRLIALDIYLDASRFVIYFHHCSLFNQSMKINLTKLKGTFVRGPRYINVKLLVHGFLAAYRTSVYRSSAMFLLESQPLKTFKLWKTSWRLTIKLVDSTYHFNTKSSTDCSISPSRLVREKQG